MEEKQKKQEEAMKLGGESWKRNQKLEEKMGSGYGHISLYTGTKFPKDNFKYFFFILKTK